MGVLITFLVISFAADALLGNVLASKLEDSFDQSTKGWTQNKRLKVIAFIWAMFWLPTAYITYQEFRPTGSGVPLTPFWLLCVGVILFFGAISSVAFVYTPVRFRKEFLAVVSVITLIVVTSLLYFRRAILAELRTVYFVLDASKETQETFPEFSSRIQLQALSVSNRVEVGLVAFGTESGCNDAIELVSPNIKDSNVTNFEKSLTLLGDMTSFGNGGLQEAVLFAIENLENRKGIHQIVVFTSGIDELCDNLDRNEIDEAAKLVDVEYELSLFSIEPTSFDEQKTLSEYADIHIHLGDNYNLSEILQNVIDSPPAFYRFYED